MEQLPQNVLDIIAAEVAQATRQTVEVLQQQAPERNYFKITEKLLYSYPTLKRIVSDKAAYTRVELQGRSGGVRFNPNKAWKSPDDILEDMEKDKEAEFDITAKEFKRLDRVIQAFKDRKEFARYPFVLLQGAGGRNAATRGRAGNDVGRSKLPS